MESVTKCRMGATDGVPPSVISDWSPPAHLQTTNHLIVKTTNLGVEKDSHHSYNVSLLNSTIMKKEEIVRTMVEAGAVLTNDVIVSGVAVNYHGDITKGFVTLQFTADDAAIDCDESGTPTKVGYAVLSLISVIGGLSDVVKPSVKHHLKAEPNALEDLLDKSTVKLVQRVIKKDESFTNPFASDATPTTATKTFVDSSLVECTLAAEGIALCKQISLFRNFGAAMFANI